MTIFDDEFNGIFKKMSNSFFNINDIFEEFKTKGSSQGPYYYGYTMTVGPDGKPIVKEYGNAKPELATASNTREPIVDTIVDENSAKASYKNGILELVFKLAEDEKPKSTTVEVE